MIDMLDQQLVDYQLRSIQFIQISSLKISNLLVFPEHDSKDRGHCQPNTLFKHYRVCFPRTLNKICSYVSSLCWDLVRVPCMCKSKYYPISANKFSNDLDLANQQILSKIWTCRNNATVWGWGRVVSWWWVGGREETRTWVLYWQCIQVNSEESYTQS